MWWWWQESFNAVADTTPPPSPTAATIGSFNKLKQLRRQQQRKHHLKIQNWEMVTMLWLLLLPRILYCWQSTLHYCCLHVGAKTLNLEISRCHLADYVRQRIVLKCVPHVQHDYFSSFNQSDHRFLAPSLPSSLPKAPCILFSMVVSWPVSTRFIPNFPFLIWRQQQYFLTAIRCFNR